MSAPSAPTSGSPMSISATNASVLSGGASTSGASRSRSALSSGSVRRTVNASVSDGVAWSSRHGDVRQRVGPVGRAVLQRQLARRLEQHVHDDPLGRRQHDVLDELLALAAPAVAADELHARSGQRDLEHAGVGGVRQVQAHDLAGLGGQRELGLPGDQQDVAEAPHRGVGRLVGAERARPDRPR